MRDALLHYIVSFNLREMTRKELKPIKEAVNLAIFQKVGKSIKAANKTLCSANKNGTKKFLMLGVEERVNFFAS